VGEELEGEVEVHLLVCDVGVHALPREQSHLACLGTTNSLLTLGCMRGNNFYSEF
jgi:hypothetical protein